jgi:hypothetical protein
MFFQPKYIFCIYRYTYYAPKRYKSSSKIINCLFIKFIRDFFQVLAYVLLGIHHADMLPVPLAHLVGGLVGCAIGVKDKKCRLSEWQLILKNGGGLNQFGVRCQGTRI